jgi:F-type H+-transporting ATPase subunit b
MLDLATSQIIIQIIAFLVMFWVLKRYGWQPLLDVLEERRNTIQAEFDSIAVQNEDVKKLAAQYEEKLREINSNARKKIQEAIAEGHKISIKIQEEAQTHAKEILHKAKLEISGEIANAKYQLKNDVVDLVINTTEKILQKTLDDANQKKLISDFVEEAQLK